MRALFEEVGWQLDRITGSHYQFVKPGKRTEVVAVHDEKVRIDVLKKLARALLELEGK